jgi:hypothetical protein
VGHRRIAISFVANNPLKRPRSDPSPLLHAACTEFALTAGHSRRALPEATIPNLAALPLHGDAGRIADLHPDAARAGLVGVIDLLRNDTLGTEPVSIREDRRVI